MAMRPPSSGLRLGGGRHPTVSVSRPGDVFRDLADRWEALSRLSETRLWFEGAAVRPVNAFRSPTSRRPPTPQSASLEAVEACQRLAIACGRELLDNAPVERLPRSIRAAIGSESDGAGVFWRLLAAGTVIQLGGVPIPCGDLLDAAAKLCHHLAGLLDDAEAPAASSQGQKPTKACKQLQQLVKTVREESERESKTATYVDRQVEQITNMVPSELRKELVDRLGDGAASLTGIEKSPVYQAWKAERDRVKKAEPERGTGIRTHRGRAVDEEDARQDRLSDTAAAFLKAAGVSDSFD